MIRDRCRYTSVIDGPPRVSDGPPRVASHRPRPARPVRLSLVLTCFSGHIYGSCDPIYGAVNGLTNTNRFRFCVLLFRWALLVRQLVPDWTLFAVLGCHTTLVQSVGPVNPSLLCPLVPVNLPFLARTWSLVRTFWRRMCRYVQPGDTYRRGTHPATPHIP